MFPQGGAIGGQTPVVLRTVHANAAIHYTTDGTEPTKDSPLYREPIPVTAEKTLKAIIIKPGLKPSAVTTARFTKAPCPPPVILTEQQVYRVKKGQPFSVTFQAKCEKPVAWHLSGQITAKVLEALDPNKDNTKVKREVAWLSLDENTGVLSGSTDRLGVNVLIVAANVVEGQAVVCDARQVIVVVDGDAASGASN
jgi:hypothetical protein